MNVHAIASFCPHGCSNSYLGGRFYYSMTPINEGLMFGWIVVGECGHEWEVEILVYVSQDAYRQHVNENIRILPMEKQKIDYHQYLQSFEWRKKSETAKIKSGRRCQVCNCSERELVLHVHHRTYENLGHELPEDLTVLCSRCHYLFEKSLMNVKTEKVYA